MYKILIADKVSEKCLEVFESNSLFKTTMKVNLSPEELLDIISDFDAIIVRSKTKVTSDVIKKGKKLKIIARAGIGLDNIDVEAAVQAGIRVLNSHESTISVAEHTIGMILALARHIPQAHGSVKERIWEREKYMGVEIYKKTLGIIGLGKIGVEVAHRARAFGMDIIVFDPYCTPEKAERCSAILVPLEELLMTSDFITLHIPKNDETIDLISYEEFAMCKKFARIINMSRGGIINETALIDAINKGIISGAALDVFENEPHINEDFLTCPQIILTPHIAGSTEDAQIKIAISLAINVINTICEMAQSENLVPVPVKNTYLKAG